MNFEGGCYCGAVRYKAEGEPMMKAECFCRECQYITGGGPNYFMILPQAAMSWTEGTPAAFTRPDLENPVTRRFCAECGTHLVTELQDGERFVLKVGTMDDPNLYGGPKAAIFTVDQQAFHEIAEGLPCFDRRP